MESVVVDREGVVVRWVWTVEGEVAARWRRLGGVILGGGFVVGGMWGWGGFGKGGVVGWFGGV